ncbi:expressed unknown protein [Seminavis robusta]|uniref:PH domain-containing protein n=1 Tax=Seminavis robusta TaxID=568900 RepID=A0A9N8D5B9_9STRA|nr:expressed unknown protein [Seminavis robusta]|eukprot:Sro4_g003490.1 n/a (1300) ;mRNA; r:165344-169334
MNSSTGGGRHHHRPQRQQQHPVIPVSSSQWHSHRRPQQHHYQQQQQYETPRNNVHMATRQTPPSAQHYQGSIASVSRQERFRHQQQEYFPPSQQQQSPFPGIGLDYVDDVPPPSPLVLDPSAPLPPSGSSSATHGNAAHQNNNKQEGMMQHLLKGIGVSGSSSSPARKQHHPQHHAHGNSQPPPRQAASHPSQQQQQLSAVPEPPNATDLARLAPRAGFLQKLGTNIHTYKRRFFVLQPSTYLYYFLSPSDTVPRGAIAMDDATVQIVETLPDGRSRLELKWPNHARTIHLEARTPEQAQEWCQSLQQERLSHVRSKWEESQQELANAKNEIEDLKRQLEHYAYVEQDRDGALEDARRWKGQFEQLDETIRVLANHVRKMPTTTTTHADNEKTGEEAKERTDDQGETGDAVMFNAEKDSDRQEGDGNDLAVAIGKDNPAAKTTAKAVEKVATEGNANETNSNEPGTRNETETEASTDEQKDRNTARENEEPAEDDDNVDKGPRDVSLLDDDAAAEEAAAALFESSNIIEQLDAPGQHFPALINACQQLRENVRLSSEEAIAAVEDTKAAQDVSKALQARMTKAEKQLCNLWEENCSIRKTLKQKKREKRVLVREVKSLMEVQKKQQQLQQQQQHLLAQQMGYHSQQRQHLTTQPRMKYALGLPEMDVEDDATIGSDEEERLINELEEHVVSSIRLHEEFISASAVKGDQQDKDAEPTSNARRLHDPAVPSSCNSTATTTASTQSGVRNIRFARMDTTSTAATVVHHTTPAKPPPSLPLLSHSSRPRDSPLPSLFDRSSFETESEADSGEVEGNISKRVALEGADDEDGEASSLQPPEMVVDESGFPKPVDIDGRSISSVAASFGGESGSSGGRPISTPLRPNPILQLDQDEMEELRRTEDGDDKMEYFKPINVARTQATSRLVCPLADVVQTKPKDEFASVGPQRYQDELQIYHLTFYTQKIGLQFQKVPAPPVKPRGLLTDAMTSDLAGDPRGADKTASELKRVAAIATWAKNDVDHGEPNSDACLQVATPVDAVLVCGFEGFDDSGNNIRPKLGARLVAFDGVSVEVGRWTFDSIRKSIKARGRPLTLSFRNDFLTTDQRAIMTKAVSQAERRPPPLSTPELFSKFTDSIEYSAVVQYRKHVEDPRPDSRASAPSLPGVSSHETDQFVNETFRTSNVIRLPETGHSKRWEDEDDLTVSTTGYHSDYHHQRPEQYRRMTGSSGGSYISSRPGAYQYRAFSEAGSSASALSSAIGPLMSNLLGGLSEKKKPVNMNPSYLHSRVPVESTPQHQEFQAGLL